MLHICCCHDDVLTEEKKRKRRFSNKYHDVHPTSYTAYPIRDAIVFGPSFGQAKNDALHYLWSHIFLSSREKISVFKNIRIRMDESLTRMRKYTIPSSSQNGFIISSSTSCEQFS